MNVDPSNPRLLHFTHVANIRGVIRDGLMAPSSSPSTMVDCADPDIKTSRRKLPVPLPPHGVVADYVPFYYAPRSPMLYRILKGGVPTYNDGQGPLVYICTYLDAVEAAGDKWVATDRNAAVATARYTADRIELLSHVDWDLMREQQWADTPDDGGRKQRRQAELLVHQRLPWARVAGLVTHSDQVREEVTRAMANASHQPPVAVVPGWYF